METEVRQLKLIFKGRLKERLRRLSKEVMIDSFVGLVLS